MTRKLRLHVPSGLYHVILRGNARHDIVFGAEDRSRKSEDFAQTLSANTIMQLAKPDPMLKKTENAQAIESGSCCGSPKNLGAHSTRPI